MKIIGYLLYILPLIFLIWIENIEGTDNERDISNQFTTDKMYKMKRPFCNAFSGCGRKRSYYGTSTYSPYYDSKKGIGIRVPIPIYKALINAASKEIRTVVSRGTNDYEIPEITQDFLVFPDRELTLQEVN